MFDKQPENQKAIERAWKIVEGRGRGELLAHEEAEAAFAQPRGERYYRLIDRLKRKMEGERGISLISVPLVGYVLATPKEQLELARFRGIQAARRQRKGAGHARALPDEECSFVELRAKQAIEEILSRGERTMRTDAQRIAFLMRPSDTRPRIARDDGGDALAV